MIIKFIKSNIQLSANCYQMHLLGAWKPGDCAPLGFVKEHATHTKHLTENTESNCIEFCNEQGSQFAGVESRLCLCGNDAPPLKVDCEKPNAVKIFKVSGGIYIRTDLNS